MPALEYAVGGIIAGYLGWKAGEWINNDDQTKAYTEEEQEEHERLEEDLVKKDRPPKGAYKANGGKKKGMPGPNDVQNDQADDAKREIERDIGRRLTYDEEKKFHKNVHGQNYNYQELVKEGKALFYE